MTSHEQVRRRWIVWWTCGALAFLPGHLGSAAPRRDDGTRANAESAVAGDPWIAPDASVDGMRSARLSPRLSRKAAEGTDELVDVIVTLRAPAAASLGAKRLGGRLGAVERRRFAGLPMRALQVPARALTSLAGDPAVGFVAADTYVYAQSLPARQTAHVPGSTSALNTPNVNYRGAGVTTAVLDTGVYPHDDFYRTLMGQLDFVNGAHGVVTSLSDPYGHGTHVAGMLGADGYNSTGAKYQGVATRANVISLRVLDSYGRGKLSDVLDGLDWVLSTGRQQYNVRLVNLSFGKGVDEAQALDPLVQAVEALWDAGVVVIVSAGNFGQSGHYTISSPGNSRKVITVGSLTDNGTGTTAGDDYVSTYSSRGPTLYDHVLKPDLVAPGNKVIAPYASSSRLGSLLPSSRIFCGVSGSCSWRYMRLSGTSMAAAMVSGAVARMLDKDPSLGPNTIKARLMKTARKIPGDPTLVGAGVLDVEAAMNATGYMYTYALSPLMNLNTSGTVVHVQNTAQLWGSSQWSAGYLWSDGSLWSSSAPLAVSGYLWSEGSLWSDSSLWADGYLWSTGFLWSEAVRPAAVTIEDQDEAAP
jgi:serine protease AprX